MGHIISRVAYLFIKYLYAVEGSSDMAFQDIDDDTDVDPFLDNHNNAEPEF